MIGDHMVEVLSALVAVSPAITPSIVDVHALRQQAGDQISQGEQPTSTIQRK